MPVNFKLRGESGLSGKKNTQGGGPNQFLETGDPTPGIGEKEPGIGNRGSDTGDRARTNFWKPSDYPRPLSEILRGGCKL